MWASMSLGFSGGQEPLLQGRYSPKRPARYGKAGNSLPKCRETGFEGLMWPRCSALGPFLEALSNVASKSWPC